ncbi:MAG: DUF2281 domain-containing protein [Bacteroidetes bacterium]|nr:DUF2281 domain-containing protein [Bacteroidota bacterium]
MDTIQLYKEIETLPDDLKKQVYDFVEFLKQKSKLLNKKNNEKQRVLGRLKGKIQMADDFDERSTLKQNKQINEI